MHSPVTTLRTGETPVPPKNFFGKLLRGRAVYPQKMTSQVGRVSSPATQLD